MMIYLVFAISQKLTKTFGQARKSVDIESKHER
jgi:hypothetical protein